MESIRKRGSVSGPPKLLEAMSERDLCSRAVQVYDELSVACPLTPHPGIRNPSNDWNVKKA